MSNSQILELTASEQLTLDEEYENCESWRVDCSKYTFIIAVVGDVDVDDDVAVVDRPAILTASTIPKEYKLIGDVNFFLSYPESEIDDNGVEVFPIDGHLLKAELEIMIGDESQRCKGYSKAILKVMINYALELFPTSLSSFFVKIGEDNVISQQLFKGLGFKEIEYVKCFREYTLALEVCEVVEMEWFQLVNCVVPFVEDGEEKEGGVAKLSKVK